MIYYCVEDELSKAVAERLIEECCPSVTETCELGQRFGGNGNIRKKLSNYNQLAQHYPVFIITDLDNGECAPALRSEWLRSARISEPLPNNMVFCVAQTEIESWLLADADGISSFLGINPALIGADIENTIIDAKEHLVALASRSRTALVRNALAPSVGSSALTGLGYNYELTKFVSHDWSPERAADNSASLRRAMCKLAALRF